MGTRRRAVRGSGVWAMDRAVIILLMWWFFWASSGVTYTEGLAGPFATQSACEKIRAEIKNQTRWGWFTKPCISDQ